MILKTIQSQKSSWKTTLSMKGNSKMEKSKVMEFSNGQMALGMKVSGKKAKPQAKENYYVPMEILMKDHSFMINLMERALSSVTLAPSMSEIGSKIYPVEGESTDGTVDLAMKVTSSLAKSMDSGSSNGRTEATMRECGFRMTMKERELFVGLMVGHIRVAGN